MSAESRSMAELASSIKALAGASMADAVGVARGSEFSAEELGELGESFGQVNSVVVFGQHIIDPIQTVRFHRDPVYAKSLVATSFADAMLRDACWRAAEVLEVAGRKAAIPRNLRYGAPDPGHSISYKKAAVLAGFGAFGRNQLLIHPEWGPWLMLRTVVTDAPLPADKRLDFSPCDGCRRCLEACPTGALSGKGIDRETCREQVGYVRQSSTVIRVSPHAQINCEECMRACPVGEAPPRLEMGEMQS